MNEKKITTAITLGDIGRTVMMFLFYLAVWAGVLWVTRQEIDAKNLVIYTLMASCWLAWVNNTRMNRVLKAKESPNA